MDAQVLVVEDDPISKMYLQGELERTLQCTVVAFGSGEEAVEYADRTSIAVVLADIGLPGIDGIETARRLRARQDVEVIFVTGNTDRATTLLAEEENPYAILSKPVDVNHVIETVQSIIQKNQPPSHAVLSPGFLLDTLYDTADVGMCVTDDTRAFVRVNRAYRDTYGYTSEELLGNQFTLVLPAADRENAARMHDEFITGDLIELPTDWRVQRKDGEVRDVYVTAGRMIGSDGRTYKVTTVTDVTDRIANKKRLESLLREKDVLLKELSHRVKNNLNLLSSVVQLEQDKLALDDKVRSSLASIANRIRAMGATYEMLQAHADVSRVEVGKMVSKIVEAVVGNSPVQVTVEIVPEIIDVDIDFGVSIGLIVNELITNSVQHGTNENRKQTFHLVLVSDKGELTIDASDNGHGLPEGFQPRETNSLGMQIIQAIAGKYGGTLDVVDPGTAHFRVRLPSL